MPGWLGWFGYAAALILLFAVIFIPMIALVLWALAKGIVLLTKKGCDDVKPRGSLRPTAHHRI